MSWAIGIVKKDEKGNTIPDGDGTFKVCFRSYEKGLIIITLGENLLRVQPPLNISKENLHKAFTILDESLTELEKETFLTVSSSTATAGKSVSYIKNDCFGSRFLL